MDLLQGEHPEILTGTGLGCGKGGSRHTIPEISETVEGMMCSIRLLVTAHINLNTSFRLTPKCIILNDL